MKYTKRKDSFGPSIKRGEWTMFWREEAKDEVGDDSLKIIEPRQRGREMGGESRRDREKKIENEE